MSLKSNTHDHSVRHVNVRGKRMVMLDELEFERLIVKADEWEPPLPQADAAGNYPAVEYARVSLARKIIRDRRRLGLTQADLAQRASVRLETLRRIESGKVSPNVATIRKIDQALQE